MYHTILLAYDGTRDGRLALREGARLAQICGAKVVLLAVLDVVKYVALAGDSGAIMVPDDMSESHRAILDEGKERLTRMGLAHETRLEKGQPADRIAAVAAEIGADLVVVGHQRQGMLERWLLGSVAGELSDRLSCSLLIGRLEISDEVLFSQGHEGTSPPVVGP